MQIWWHNIYYINEIAIKNIIILVQKGRNNEKLLIIKNIDKTVITKITKILSAINFDDKYN